MTEVLEIKGVDPKTSSPTMVAAIKGNINSELIDAAKADMVHFYAHDYTAPRSQDVTEQFKPLKRKRIMDETTFKRAFCTKITDLFENEEEGIELSVADVYKILLNVDSKFIEKVFIDLLEEKGLFGSAKKEFVDKLVKEHNRLMLNGSFGIVVNKDDFIHVPGYDGVKDVSHII